MCHRTTLFLSAFYTFCVLWIPTVVTSVTKSTTVSEEYNSPNSSDKNNLLLSLIRISVDNHSEPPENATSSSVHPIQNETKGYQFDSISNISTLHSDNSSSHFTSFTSVFQYNMTVTTPSEPSGTSSGKTTEQQQHDNTNLQNNLETSDLSSKVKILIEHLRSVSEPNKAASKLMQGFKQRLQGSQVQKSLAFLDDMLKDYDKRAWPTYGTDLPTTCQINLHINTLGPVNAANMDYGMDIYLRMFWRDPRLRLDQFGVNKLVTLNAEEIAQNIWKPDIFFRNVKEASFHTVTVPNKLIKIYPNGDVLYSLRITLRLACQMSFRHYPLDTQKCYVILGPYAQTMDQVVIEWRKLEPITIEKSLELPEFDVANLSHSQFVREIDTGSFSFLNVTVILVRQNGFHIIQTYMPTFLLVMISWVSFWLNVDATPARVTLGVTTLLTLTTVAYGVRMQLPPVSYIKAIDVWIGSCSVFVFGALLEFTLVNYLSRSKLRPEQFKKSINIFHWTKKVHMQDMDISSKPDSQIASNLKRAKAVDRFCRVFFPVTFFIFNIIYWLYYLYIPDEYIGW